MRETSLIVWDEAMMSNVDHIDCVDRTLRDILKVDKPFGGLAVVFSGDPRQILPVVRHGNRPQIVKACIRSSALWDSIKQISFTENMRVCEDEVKFASYILTIGNGTAQTHPEIGEEIIQIPHEHLVKTVDELIDKVFPNIANGYEDKYLVSKRAILTPLNDNVDKINETIMDRFPGMATVYRSADTVAEEDLHNTYPTVFLNSLTLSGMPPHAMALKVGAPVILLRNLRTGHGNGLKNGTRLILLQLGVKVLEAEIASGVNKGKRVLLPRITIAPSDTELPFTLRRWQFPVRPCFAMSTNKAQGQTLDFVGIYLPEHVFTHGQLYVALSRARKSSSVAVFVDNIDGYTKNIVYKEVL
jgi:ATP-dependent exoDNAse (exonuclease V) alpha subunit